MSIKFYGDEAEEKCQSLRLRSRTVSEVKTLNTSKLEDEIFERQQQKKYSLVFSFLETKFSNFIVLRPKIKKENIICISKNTNITAELKFREAHYKVFHYCIHS